jgi:hypothetical protein
MSLLPDLTQSTANWTSAQRRRAAIICSIVSVVVAAITVPRLGDIFEHTDSGHYLLLAAGQPAMLPFASRQLGPLLVRGMVHAFGISIHSGFLIEGTVAMLVLFATVLWYLLRSGAPRFMIAATIGLFFWSCQYSDLVLPDLLYGALICIFLILLDRQRFLLAALMMLPLAVARESTLLTVVCLLIAGWRRLRLGEAAVALASMVAGLLIVKRLTANALPNHEHISPILYLFAKMPWTLLKNFLGIYPWSNVYPECAGPRWQLAIHLGPVHAIGVCGFEPRPPLSLLFYALASFGLFPLLFLAVRRFRKPLAPATASPRAKIFLRFCVIYGVISFALAGLLGELFQRLFAYSWPLFLIALPILLVRRNRFSGDPSGALVVRHSERRLRSHPARDSALDSRLVPPQEHLEIHLGSPSGKCRNGAIIKYAKSSVLP